MSLSHYLDLQPQPEEEMTVPQVMADIFAMIHKALAFSKEEGVAISLPAHQNGSADGARPPSLGNILRLHGSEESLKNLLKRPELLTLSDYTAISAVQPVPRETSHRVLRRVQVKSGMERLRRRAMARHKITEEEAKKRYPDGKEASSHLPYFAAKSSSSSQLHFRIFIEHGKEQAAPTEGKFSSYGLGTGDRDKNISYPTVPWF